MTFNRNQRRWLSKIGRSALALCRAISNNSKKFLLFAVGQLSLEITVALTTIGIAYLLSSWGIPQNIAFIVGIAGAIVLVILLSLIWFYFSAIFQSKNNSPRDLKIAVKIAAISRKDSTWTEYQDWLHDILLARQQLIEAKYPGWQVRLITYWRLGALCIGIAIGKIKQISSKILGHVIN